MVRRRSRVQVPSLAPDFNTGGFSMKIVLDNSDQISIKVTRLNTDEIKYYTGQDTDYYKISAKFPDELILDENAKWTFGRLFDIGIPVSCMWDGEEFLSYFASKKSLAISKESNGSYFYQLIDKYSDKATIYHSEKDLTKDIIKHLKEQEKNRSFNP